MCSGKSSKLLFRKGISSADLCSIMELFWRLLFLFTLPQPQYQLGEGSEGYFFVEDNFETDQEPTHKQPDASH